MKWEKSLGYGGLRVVYMIAPVLDSEESKTLCWLVLREGATQIGNLTGVTAGVVLQFALLRNKDIWGGKLRFPLRFAERRRWWKGIHPVCLTIRLNT